MSNPGTQATVGYVTKPEGKQNKKDNTENLNNQDNNLYSQINHKLQWHREATTEKYNITHT
jgi:hypothetical protein